MKLLRYQAWGFTARLIMIALVPACLMLVAVNLSLYFAARDEVAADISERGRLVAATLSEGSRYGVISDNTGVVERTVRGLMATDRSIASIHVLDTERNSMVVVDAYTAADDAQVFEVPVTAGSLDVNLFDITNSTIAQGGRSSVPGGSRYRPAGYVQVTMSPRPLLEAKRHRLYVGSLTVLVAALLSAGVGLLLAKRMREPLGAVMGALRSIRQGRYDIQLPTIASGELGELQATILEMAKSLGVSHQQLEDLVASRTRELEAAVRAARQADADKRRLIAHGNALVEEERRRISMEIHDDLNAALVSVGLEAAALAAKASTDGRAEIRDGAERIAAVTDKLYARARDIGKRLRPEVIDALGLPGAVDEIVRYYDELHPACHFELHVDPQFPLFPNASPSPRTASCRRRCPTSSSMLRLLDVGSASNRWS